jgi:type II secretory pathway component PulC
MAEKTGLRKGDVIVRMGDQEIRSTQDLMKTYQSVKWMGQSELIIIRSQTQQKITVFFK